MTEKENEVVQLKQDLSRQLAQHRQQQQDQEKEMKKLQDNYETQLQFKVDSSLISYLRNFCPLPTVA